MAVYAMGDLHLSEGVEKPMDGFRGWNNYVQRTVDAWQAVVQPEDTVVLAGDTSWGMTMQQALPDFLLLEHLPGRKLLLKGNHDYWWSSVTSMTNFLQQHGMHSFAFLQNNHYVADGLALCGSRGWMFENGEEQEAKIIRREGLRLEYSLESVTDPTLEKVVFLHYPPIYAGQETPEYLDIMRKYGVTRCYYGHIHGFGHRNAVKNEYKGIRFSLISADYLKFVPLKI